MVNTACPIMNSKFPFLELCHQQFFLRNFGHRHYIALPYLAFARNWSVQDAREGIMITWRCPEWPQQAFWAYRVAVGWSVCAHLLKGLYDVCRAFMSRGHPTCSALGRNVQPQLDVLRLREQARCLPCRQRTSFSYLRSMGATLTYSYSVRSERCWGHSGQRHVIMMPSRASWTDQSVQGQVREQCNGRCRNFGEELLMA